MTNRNFNGRNLNGIERGKSHQNDWMTERGITNVFYKTQLFRDFFRLGVFEGHVISRTVLSFSYHKACCKTSSWSYKELESQLSRPLANASDWAENQRTAPSDRTHLWKLHRFLLFCTPLQRRHNQVEPSLRMRGSRKKEEPETDRQWTRIGLPWLCEQKR